MFGSDQMVLPEKNDAAVDAIEQAAFLSDVEKRDIFLTMPCAFFASGRMMMTREQVRNNIPAARHCLIKFKVSKITFNKCRSTFTKTAPYKRFAAMVVEKQVLTDSKSILI